LFNLIKGLFNLTGWSIKIAVLIILSPVILFYYVMKGSAAVFKKILGMDGDDEIDYDQPLPEDNNPNPLLTVYRFIRKIVVTVFKMVILTIVSPVIMLYYFLNWLYS
jgi:hypothetical protein